MLNPFKLQNKFKNKIDIKNFKIVREIKKGGFGSVYSVQDLRTNEYFAAKIINNSKPDELSKKMISREIGIMMRLQHPTIIKFIGYSLLDFFGGNNCTIIMELAKRGSLAEAILKSKKSTADIDYDNTAKQIILVGIARGMMYLHQHHIIHRDLKPDNILLDQYLHPLITDFGLSKIYDLGYSISQSQTCGTSIYMAPEIISGNRYSGKADVYSFGILMYEVITELVPYPLFQEKGKLTIYQFNEKVIKENYRPQFTFSIKPSLKNLIERCWSKDPSERPTFEEIFKKLAYNIEDSIYDICESDENENKFYLDDVDIEELYAYLDSFTENDFANDNNISSNVFDDLKRRLEAVEDENKRLKNDNRQILKKIENIEKENQQIKLKCQNDITSLMEQNEQLKKDNEKIMSLIHELMREKELSVNDSDDKIEVVSSSPVKKDSEAQELITIHDFNALPLASQQSVVSTIIKNSESSLLSKFLSTVNPIFIKLNNLLTYLMKLKSPSDESRYFSIATNNHSQRFDLLKDEQTTNLIFIVLSSAVEKLYEKSLLNSSEFLNILKQFDQSISFELKYPSDCFQNVYDIVMKIRQTEITKMKIVILISEMKATDTKFKKNADITYVNIKMVKSIGDNSFYDCSSVVQITIPDTVTSIGSSSFCGCSSLKFLTIPASVTTIGKHAFEGCFSLRYITIPSSVTSIDCSAFEACSSLMEIIIQSKLSSINDSTFCGCSSLHQIEIPSSVNSIGDTSFCECSSLKKIVIPSSVKSIGKRCFYKCTALDSIQISESVKFIESSTFECCSSLTKITIPSSVVKIGNSAFKKCSSLEQITIPPSVADIEASAFECCSSLKQITIPSSVTSIESFVFRGCSSLNKINIPNNLTSIKNSAFEGCAKLAEVTIVSSVTLIGDSAFEGCSLLSKIIVPSSVTHIGKNAFNGCSSLTQLYIPSSLPIEDIGIGEKTIVSKII